MSQLVEINNIIDKNQIQDRIEIEIDESLIQLSKSIKERGLINPITIKEIGENKYQIVCGQRRLLAHKLIGETHIQAIIKKFNSNIEEIMNILDENIQRKKLNALEEYYFKMKIVYISYLSDNETPFTDEIRNNLDKYAIEYIQNMNYKRILKYSESKKENKLYEDFIQRCEKLNFKATLFFNNFFLLRTHENIIQLIKENKITVQIAKQLHKIQSETFFDVLIKYIQSKQKAKIEDVNKFIKDMQAKDKNKNTFDTDLLVNNIKKIKNKKNLDILKKINKRVELLIKKENDGKI